MRNYRLAHRELTTQEAEYINNISSVHYCLLSGENKVDYYGRLADFTENLKDHYSPVEIDKTLLAQLAKLSSVDHSLVPCTRVDFDGNHSFGNHIKTLFIEFNQDQKNQIEIPIIIEKPKNSEIQNHDLVKLINMRKFSCSQSPLAE